MAHTTMGAYLFLFGITEKDWSERFAERIGLTHETEIRGMGAVYRRQVITVVPQKPVAG